MENSKVSNVYVGVMEGYIRVEIGSKVSKIRLYRFKYII